MNEKIDLRAVAEAALREADGLVATTDGCKTPIDKCRAKKGPAECRVHCVEYFDRLCDAVTFEEAKQGLKEQFGIEAIPRKCLNKVEDNPKIVDFVLSSTKSVPEEEHEFATRDFYVTLAMLKEMHPNVAIPRGIFFGGIPQSESDGALASIDSYFGGKAYMVFSPSFLKGKFKGYAFGHDDNRLAHDVLRHEIGHWLTDDNTIEALKEMFVYFHAQQPKSSLEQALRNEVSDYAADSFAKNNPTEVIAELFTRRTSPDYSTKPMNKYFEEFVDLVMLNDLNGE